MICFSKHSILHTPEGKTPIPLLRGFPLKVKGNATQIGLNNKETPLVTSLYMLDYQAGWFLIEIQNKSGLNKMEFTSHLTVSE